VVDLFKAVAVDELIDAFSAGFSQSVPFPFYSGAFKALTRFKFFKVRKTTRAEIVDAVATTVMAKA
jgi:hypothetical protein